jgi:hypothetical protein
MLRRAFAVMRVRRLIMSVAVMPVPVDMPVVVMVVFSPEIVVVVVIVIVVCDDAARRVHVIVAMADAVRQRRNDHAKHENHQPRQTLAGASAGAMRQRTQLGLPA